MNVDYEKEELIESLFEQVLKRINVQAFNALLTCGVRDIAGLVRLSVEDLKKVGISSRISTELMEIKRQLFEQIELGRESKSAVPIDSHMKELQESDDEVLSKIPALKQGTIIPKDLKCAEHWASDPADWSLLSRTLRELFWVTLPSNMVLNDDDEVSISDLGIFPVTLTKFVRFYSFLKTQQICYSIFLSATCFKLA